jgi:phosphatidate cytidylyltransferase
MKIRIITSIVALAVFIGVLLAPFPVFECALAAVILFMVYECAKATDSDTAEKTIGFVSAALIMLSVYLGIFVGGSFLAFLPQAILAVVVLYMVLVLAKHGKKNYKDILSGGFMMMYVVLSMSCACIVKEKFGTASMLMIFICAWATDTCAYFSGKAFGKHKLIPHVSPNKTVEGSIGGIIGAMVICMIYLFIAVKVMHCSISSWGGIYIQGAVIGFVGGVFSQVGDLIASSVKRDTGVKDFGWIFPGHGGFMDRFDSVMFIAPIILGVLYYVPMLVNAFAG